MLPKMIIWGECQQEKKTMTAYKGQEKRYYEQVDGRLVQYVKRSSQKELMEELKSSNQVIVCTNYIEETGLIMQLIEQKKHILLVMPQMKKMTVSEILKVSLVISDVPPYKYQKMKQEVIALWGESQIMGDLLMELLRHLHLFQQMKRYVFYLKGEKVHILENLAEVEDLLREYIDVKGTLTVQEWEEKDKFITNRKYCYLLKAIK